MANADVMWLAVGNAGNVQAYSRDGKTWTAYQITTAALFGVAFDGATWVVGGGATNVLVSTNTTGPWSAATSYPAGGANTINVAAYNGRWVSSIAGTAGILTTTNPSGTWSVPTSQPFGSGGSYSVGYLNGYWLAARAGIAYATDPTGTWSTATLSPTTTSAMEGQWSYGVASSGTAYYVKTADNSATNRVYYATNPTGTWTGATGGFTTTVIRANCYANGYWVVGGGGEMRYATDPTGTWTAVGSHPFTQYCLGITYRDGLWVATGSSTSGSLIAYATDPTGTWTTATGISPVSTKFFYVSAVGGGTRTTPRVQTSVNRAAIF